MRIWVVAAVILSSLVPSAWSSCDRLVGPDSLNQIPPGVGAIQVTSPFVHWGSGLSSFTTLPFRNSARLVLTLAFAIMRN